MKRRNTQTISDLLAGYIRTEGLETPLAEHRAIEAWSSVAGEVAAANTLEVSLRNQTFIVRVASPVVRHQLLMRSTEILRKLNEAAGVQILHHLKLI